MKNVLQRALEDCSMNSKVVLTLFFFVFSLALSAQTVTVDDNTPGVSTNYTFEYTLGQTSGVNMFYTTVPQNYPSFPYSSTHAFTADELDIYINDTIVPFSKWGNLVQIWSGGIQIYGPNDDNGQLTYPPAGTDVKLVFKSIFANPSASGEYAFHWWQANSQGLIIEDFRDTIVIGSIPEVTVNSNLSTFEHCQHNPSVSQSFTLSGQNLTSDVWVNGFNGIEFSLDDNNYSSYLSLAHSSGELSTTTIYLRASETNSNVSGNVVVSSNDMSSEEFAVSVQTLGPTYGTDNQMACASYTWIDGVTYTSSNNSATHTITNDQGCDSIITLNLIIDNYLDNLQSNYCENYDQIWLDANSLDYYNQYYVDGQSIESLNFLDVGPGAHNLEVKLMSSSLVVDSVNSSYQWIDLSAYTSDTLRFEDDQDRGPFSLGFDFPWFGEIWSEIYITSNGYLYVDGGTEYLSFLEADLNPEHTGSIKLVSMGTAPNRMAVLEFDDVPFYDDNNSSVSLQVVFYEDGKIDLNIDHAYSTYEEEYLITLIHNNEWLYELESNVALDNWHRRFITSAIVHDSASQNFFVDANPVGDTTQVVVCDVLYHEGEWYNESGIYPAYVPNGNECDSVYFIDLTVNEQSDSEIYLAAIDGNETHIAGSVFYGPGTYTVVGTNAVGCDSVIYAEVVSVPNWVDSLNTVYCSNSTPESFESVRVHDGLFWNHTNMELNGVDVDTIHFDQLEQIENVVELQVLKPSVYSDFSNGYYWEDLSSYTDTVQIFQDDNLGPFPIGFEFAYFDTTYTEFYFEHGGEIAFDAEGSDEEIEIVEEFYLYPEAGGTYKYVTLGEAPNRRLICEFDSIPFQADTNAFIRAQIVLHESSNYIDFNIDTCAHNTARYTVFAGLEHLDTQLVQYRFDEDDTPNLNDWYVRFVQYTDTVDTYQDSIYVYPVVYDTVDVAVCDAYTWDNGTEYTSSTVVTEVWTNHMDCDSIVTLNLTIYNADSAPYFAATYDDEYEWNGTTYDSDGSYIYTTTSVHSCDSTAQLELTLLDNPLEDMPTLYCENDTIVDIDLSPIEYLIGPGTSWHSFNPSEAGPGDHVISSVVNTNNTYHIDSTGLYSYIDIDAVSDTVFMGDDDMTHFDDGMYPFFSFTYFGQEVDSFTICSNGWISFDSDSYDEYAIELPVEDEEYDNSIFLIDVDLDPSEGDNENTGLIKHAVVGDEPNRVLVVEFDSVPYYENNDVYYSAQLHLYEGSNYIEIHTKEANNYENSEYASQGLQSPDMDSAIVVPGRNYTLWSVTDDVIKFYPAESIADTISTVVTVIPNAVSHDTMVVCDSIIWNDESYTSTGNYQYIVEGTNGCDSICYLHLTVLESSATISHIAYYGDEYLWNGMNLDSSGVYTYDTTNAVACDSTAVIEISLLENPFENIPNVICEGDSTSYAFTEVMGEVISGNGLDSTLVFDPIENGLGSYTLHASYNTSSYGYSIDQTGSFGYVNIDAVADTFDINTIDNYYDAAIVPMGFEFVADGVSCDSVIFIDGLLAPKSGDVIPLMIVTAMQEFGGSSFDFVNSGMIRWGTVGTAPNRVFVLEVNDLASYNTENLFYSAQAQLYEGSNRIEIHTKSLEGIEYGMSYTQMLYVDSTGDEFIVPGRDGFSPWTAENDYVAFVPNQGLSASISHTIDIVPNYQEDAFVDACGSYIWGNGVEYFADTTVVHNYQSIYNCDSIVTLHLTINNPSASAETLTVCDAFDWNGESYTSSGVYTYIATNAEGCDSVATLNLTVNNSAELVQDLAIDFGQTVEVGSSIYSESGIYVDVLTTEMGCDSVITTNLTVFSYEYLNQDITICADEFYSINGNSYNQAGVYVDTIVILGASDSVITTNLSVLAVPEVPEVFQMWSTTLSTISSYEAYQWYLNGELLPGETNQTLDIFQSGYYAVEVFNDVSCGTFSKDFGFGNVGIPEELLEEFVVYPNPTRTSISVHTPETLGTNYNLKVVDMYGRLLYLHNDEIEMFEDVQIDIEVFQAGMYFVVVDYTDGKQWISRINKL